MGDVGSWADVQSCHRGSSSVLRLPGMRKPRVSGSSSGWRAVFCGGGTYHACVLVLAWFCYMLYANARGYSGVVCYSKSSKSQPHVFGACSRCGVVSSIGRGPSIRLDRQELASTSTSRVKQLCANNFALDIRIDFSDRDSSATKISTLHCQT